MVEKKSLKIGNIILIIIVLGLSGYIIYDKFVNKDIKQPVNSEQNEVETKDVTKELDINSLAVKDLYNQVDVFNDLSSYDENYNKNYFGYFFRKDETLVKDIPDPLKVMIGIKNVSPNDADLRYYNDFEISEDVVKESIQKIFGNIQYQNVDTPSYICSSGHKYNSSSHKYSNSLTACGFECYEGLLIETVIVKAEEVNDDLNIYVKPEFSKTINTCDSEKTCSKEIYSDINIQNKVASVDCNQKNNDSYIEKLDTYKFMYKKDGISYYFQGVQKVNK